MKPQALKEKLRTLILCCILPVSCGPVPGGKLTGNITPQPDTWQQIINEKTLCEIESRPSKPHSIQLECFLYDNNLYVQSHRWVNSSWWPTTSWAEIWQTHPNVSVRIGEKIYLLTATRTKNQALRDSILKGRGYESPPDGITVFSLESRENRTKTVKQSTQTNSQSPDRETSMEIVEEAYNYHKIDDQFSTSGILNKAQLKALGEAGFEGVINLLPNNSQYAVESEQPIIEDQGLSYFHISVDFSQPTEADYLAFEEQMKKLKGKKVLVHCAANFRASAFFAIYAKNNLDWNDQQADELIHSIWKPSEHKNWPELIAALM